MPGGDDVAEAPHELLFVVIERPFADFSEVFFELLLIRGRREANGDARVGEGEAVTHSRGGNRRGGRVAVGAAG